jgi:hypothetical protein
MNTYMEINLSRSEALRRFVLGSGLIGAVLTVPTLPAWIALVACYPVLTAIMQWDPANALSQKVVAGMGSGMQKALFVRSAEM